ncbi:hypothetical protein GJ496_004340, partial [Pomphorhynchus laevis]
MNIDCLLIKTKNAEDGDIDNALGSVSDRDSSTLKLP